MKKYKVIKLMTLAFEAGFKQASVVEAGLESKETDILYCTKDCYLAKEKHGIKAEY